MVKRIVAAAAIMACLLGTIVFLLFAHHSEEMEKIEEVVVERAVQEPILEPVDWEKWLAVNPDIVGWITIPDTPIDFPIVAAPADDPTFYLSHGIDRRPNGYGAVYLDAACEGHLIDSINSVVFGHNCNDGELFGAIANYSASDFVEAHPLVFIRTPETERIYRVGFSEVIDGADAAKRIEFRDRSDFEKYYSARFENASAVYDERIPEKMITLCTCSYGSDNERTLVYLQPFDPVAQRIGA